MNAIMILLAAMAVAAPAPQTKAATKREQLAALVAQVQKAPTDDALRKQAIALAFAIKPAPALPEEAERHMVRGGAAVKGAKDASGWKTAAREFEAASLAAPWSGDAYYNLAVAQDKAGDYVAALRSLSFAELALPGSKDVKTFRYEVEFRRDESNSPEGRARKDDESLRALDGAVFLVTNTDWKSYRVDGRRLVEQHERTTPRSCLCGVMETARCQGPIGEKADCDSVVLAGRRGVQPCKNGNSDCRIHYEISEDGQTLVVKVEWPSFDQSHPSMRPDVHKRKR